MFNGAWTAGYGYLFNCALPLAAYALYKALVVTGFITSAAATGLIVGYYLNEGEDRISTESAPNDKPTGTIPIDESKGKLGLGKDEVHQIKHGVGAGIRDWVGIAPNGDVITTDSDGYHINNGPYTDYIMGKRR